MPGDCLIFGHPYFSKKKLSHFWTAARGGLPHNRTKHHKISQTTKYHKNTIENTAINTIKQNYITILQTIENILNTTTKHNQSVTTPLQKKPNPKKQKSKSLYLSNPKNGGEPFFLETSFFSMPPIKLLELNNSRPTYIIKQ